MKWRVRVRERERDDKEQRDSKEQREENPCVVTITIDNEIIL